MKARLMEMELIKNAVPKLLSEDDQTWSSIKQAENIEDQRVKMWWYSEVPGSGAPERLIIAAMQDMENRGLDVSQAEKWIEPGLKAWETDDMASLHRITARIFHELFKAPKNQKDTYWTYEEFYSWEQYESSVKFPDSIYIDVNQAGFLEKIHAGWLAQIIAGAIGTALEGYTTDQLMSLFGEVKDYLRKPNTFNDDITYELAFLRAFSEKGYKITASDIAEEWVALIPFGWSAEDIALRNLKLGIYPPESGVNNNPFYEWIGAQMRGAICGMVAPGNPKEAARLAWMDGSISHYNNGIIGEIFNAIMVSMAFSKKEVREILIQSINLIPEKSEYFQVVTFALQQCRRYDEWLKAWRLCEEKYERYNWIHAYPNAAAEVIALWYGNGDFNKTMEIISLSGRDVDCNAAQIATILGIIHGLDGIEEKWKAPIGDELETYVRTMNNMTISGLAKWTVQSIRQACNQGGVCR
ncbi:ADP-ribosylglycohydrolase family protein [Tindallia californiensis]|uniref:ADP-ribosylglycohydrolase n=1 Tax=Tindallia californiensis TaxID=159292 RepID=A0A1H3I796_9FIRM|nr:ADP-ribosylglycohydrolase family protein [Tindallia californiensis]SDY23567.1 ADP-ribosylglycohydrolase [Tindallia californiensis]